MSGEPPLAGVRVLDSTSYATGPFMTGLLAQLGAKVIKIERPPHGDPERFTTPAYFAAFNRGKASVALDTRDAADRAMLDELVAGADVFVEGFRPGAADRAGLGFDRLRTLRKGLIYISLPGFSSTGPYAAARGYDVQYQAIAGALAFDIDPGGTPVYRSAFPVFDYAAAMYAVIALLALLPDRPGEGIRLEVPIVAAGLAFTFPAIVDTLGDSAERGRVRHTYRTADGQFLAITVPQDQDFQALCTALGRPDVRDDPAFATYRDRTANGVRLGQIVGEEINARTADEWLAALVPAGVPVARVNTPETIFDDPEVKSLGLIDEDGGRHMHLPVLGLPQRELAPAPGLGDDTDRVRAEGWGHLRA